MTTVSKRVFTINNTSGQVTETPGTSASQQPTLEVGQHLDVSKLSASSYTLEDAYWSDRQRKIGIAPSTQQEPASEEAYMRIQEEQIQFIKKHFTQKECRRFLPQLDQCGKGKSCQVKALKCHCGESLLVHLEIGSVLPEEYASLSSRLEDVLTETLPAPQVKWSPKDDFMRTATNAFGKIDFNIEQIGGKKPAKYIRLSSDDSVDDCLELMKSFWHFMEPEPPKLVISVVGGAKNFKLDGRNRSIFSTGLIKAAKTTKAWLITSGFNMGVMKSVGQAVHEGQTFQWSNDRVSHVLRCIGIAPWGYVKDRQCLESDGNGKFNAHYRSSTLIEHKQPVPLNPDHTHFIFVDDGYRGRYGGVAKFRSEFEKKIAQDIDGGLGIPVVLLLVEGGTDAIQDVSASLSQGIPVVVCAGTGRAADIIAYAYNHTVTTGKQRTMSENNREKLKQKIAQTYKPKDEELENLTSDVIKSCQKEDLIVIFNMKKHEELDLAILSVLLKGKTNSSLQSQLMLAMTWNRADIAQEEIFREDVNWSEESLESFLTTALIEDKIEFVKLLLNNGIIMHEYLTTQRLETLYNSIPEYFYLYQILKASAHSKTGPFTVKDISNFLQDLLDRYDDDEMIGNQKEPKFFRNPYKQLLIWAVLMNRCELAHLFLELGEEPITSALICTALCLGMESKVPKFMSLIRDSFHNMKVEFEKLAIGVLDECHSNNPDKAVMLVGRKSPVWSHLTCLQIAISASDQAFVSSVACQNSIDNVWKNGIISSWPKVFMCAVFPPLILFLVEMNLMGKKVMPKTQKILTFYTAPLTKFSLYSAAYVAFLALFTYMISVDYNQVPSVTEWIAVVWIFTFLVGKIHAFLVFPSASFSGKMRDYLGIFDKLDCINLVLALCAFCVRWRYVTEGKIIYCINAIIFYISIMKLYTANRILGPKLYMINRMLVELGNFIMVLFVFLLAYGVASQALLYKHRDTSWQILKDVVYFPYWQLFGELFLEELETDDACTRALQESLNGALTDAENTCKTFHWLVPVLLAIYLFMGNVLLLNLLIAIFSHVFDTVENNSIEIWKFQMYFLVMEFQNQPLVFPPLSVFVNAWHFLRWMCNKLSYHKQPKPEQFRKYHLEYLSLFEKEMLANKLRPVKANIMFSLDMKFNALLARMDELTKMIEEEVLSSLPHETVKNKQETNNDFEPKSKKKYGQKMATMQEHDNTETAPAKPEMNGENSPNSASVKLIAKLAEENQQPANSDKDTLADTSVKSMSQTSPHEDQISLLSSQHKYSTKNEKGHVPVDNVNSCSLSRVTLSNNVGNQSLDSNEDLVPVELLPNEEPMLRAPHRSKKHSTRKFQSHTSFDSTDSDTPHQKMRVKRPSKKDSDDDLQSRIERASHSNYSRKML